MAPKASLPKPLDNARKRSIAGLISKARVRELQYAEAALQSAHAAALQILEKRIEFLEKKAAEKKEPESATIAEFFIDVLLDVVLGGAGSLLKDGVESMLRPIVRSRQAFYVKAIKSTLPIDRITIEAKLELDGKALRAARQAARKRLEENFTRMANSDDYRALMVVPDALIDAAVSLGKDKAKALAKSDPKTEEIKLKSGKTPTVMILVAAQKFHNKQKAAIELQYDALKAELDYGDMDEERGKELEGLLSENASGRSNDELEAYSERLLYFYEFCMWASVTRINERVTKQKVSYPGRYSENAVFQESRDPANYKLDSANDDGVVFTLPETVGADTSSGLPGPTIFMAKMRYRIGVPKYILDYWIDHFPYTFDDLNSRTIREEIERKYGAAKRAGKDADNYLLILSYDRAVSLLRSYGSDVERSWSAIKGLYEKR
jgi:hypothetical protein